MKKSLTLLLLAFMAFALNAQTLKTLTWDGQQREYLEYIPASYSAETPAPVLFMLHGMGDDVNNFFSATHFTDIAEEKGWILVCPQALPFTLEIPYVGSQAFGTCWAAGVTVTVTFQIYGMPINYDVTVNGDVDDSGFLMATLNTLDEEYNLDYDSIFFTGFSLGACMCHRMAIEHGDHINGIAAVSGVVGNDVIITPIDNVNVLEIFGTDDEMISYDNAEISLQGYGTHSIGLPAEETVEFWRSSNQCSETPIHEVYPDTQNDGLTFEMYSYLDGDDDTRVSFLKVNHGMHRWYTGGSYDIDYTEEIMRFFTGTLDVTDMAEQSEEPLTLYPNPATNVIYVDTKEEVKIFDLCGKMVLQSQATSKIDVSTLPEGMYFVKSKNGCSKLIINR